MKKSFHSRFVRTIFLSVIAVTVIIILCSTVLFVKTFIEKEQEMAETQIELIANSLEQEMESFYQLGSMVDNDLVLREYMELEEGQNESGEMLNNVALSLVNYKKLNVNISYLTLIRYEGKAIRYMGSRWRADGSFVYESFINGYDNAERLEDYDIRIRMENDIYGYDDYVMNLYFPIYSSRLVYKEIGFLCVGISESNLREFYKDGAFENIYLADADRNILSDVELAYIGDEIDDQIRLDSGMQLISGRYVFNVYLKNYGWYLVAEINLSDIMSNVFQIVAMAVLIMAVMSIGLYIYCFRATQKLIQPLEDLKERMASVSCGDMTIRMDVEYEESEFNDMASSFNIMVKNVDSLMEKIKEEQKEKKRYELNALQEQIKPHFLYNTLECIHMQAVIDKNDEISRLVMALANYYRLSLGNGQSYVTLEQEIKHIENYLVIQNVRFGNNIEYRTEIPEELKNLIMLKMTLQPLVENCIYHGIKAADGKRGVITVKAKREGRDVVLFVMDDGEGMTEEAIEELNESLRIYAPKEGYGIRNVNRRIQISFGETYGLTYKKNPGKGITVEIRVPYHIDRGM